MRTRDEVLERLRRLADDPDPEYSHELADATLLAFINDDEISAAYKALKKWYG